MINKNADEEDNVEVVGGRDDYSIGNDEGTDPSVIVFS